MGLEARLGGGQVGAVLDANDCDLVGVARAVGGVGQEKLRYLFIVQIGEVGEVRLGAVVCAGDVAHLPEGRRTEHGPAEVVHAELLGGRFRRLCRGDRRLF